MSQKIKGCKFAPHWLELGKLRVHPIVQQPYLARHADNLKAHFDANALGPILVVPDPDKDKHYLIWDGQHRHAAASALYPAHHTIFCYVYTDLTVAKLAELQVELNKGKKAWPSVYLFHQQLIAEEPSAVDIERILAKHSVGILGRSGNIRATNALEAAYKKVGADGLDRVIQILHGAWGDDQDAYNSVMLTGASLVIEAYNGKIDTDDLATRLRKHGTASTLLGQARSKGKNDRINTAVAVAKLLVNTYNVRRQTTKLPSYGN